MQVLVTGVDQHEGAHAARLLASQGHSVIAHSFCHGEAEAIAASITMAGGSAAHVVADLTLESDVARLFTDLERDRDGIDALVHTAWLPGPETATKSIDAVSFADWQRFAQQHTALMFLPIRAACEAMRRRHRPLTIVAVKGLGSIGAAAHGARCSPARASNDGAVEGFVRALVGCHELLRIDTIRWIEHPNQEPGEPVSESSFDQQLSDLVSSKTGRSILGHFRPRTPLMPHHEAPTHHAPR